MASVRNIQGIGSSKPIPIHHLIPPTFSAIWKIELDNGTTTYDVTDLVDEGGYSDGVTDNIGSFDFKIVDPDKVYSDNIDPFDYINIYLDYGNEAITLRFKGVVEKSGREDFYFKVSGRSIGMITTGKNIIYSETGARSTILKEILTANFPTINQDNIEEDITEITVNYSETPFQEIVEELCGNHHDFYIDCNLNAYYFTKGSRQNETEAISQDYNHISTEEYSADSEETITKVRVYGKKQGDIALFATSTSSTDHTNGIEKERKIDDSTILTTAQATELADYEYESGIEIPHIGSVTSLLLPTIAPGEKLKMAIPIDKIDPDYYQINSFTHKFPDLETTVEIQKRKIDIPKIIKKNVQLTEAITENDNPYNLDFSKIITFEEDSGSHSNTEINEGYLKIKVGESSGQWTSDVYTLSSSVDGIAFKMTGDNLVRQYSVTTSNLWYSFDGGTTFHILKYGATTEVPSGVDLRLRIDLNSSDAQVKAIAFQYSLK